jgi:hypothetical protein
VPVAREHSDLWSIATVSIRSSENVDGC